MSELVNELRRGIKSALENFQNRMVEGNLSALEDIEDDLEYALKAVKAMIASEIKRRNDDYDAMNDFNYVGSKYHY